MEQSEEKAKSHSAGEKIASL